MSVSDMFDIMHVCFQGAAKNIEVSPHSLKPSHLVECRYWVHVINNASYNVFVVLAIFL